MTGAVETPVAGEPARARDAGPLLEVIDLVKHFPVTRGIIFRKEVDVVRAVDGVSFEIATGETLGLVGESGSGKTTLSRTILRLIEPTSGSIRFEGAELVGMGRDDLRRTRARMQMVFQDPYASLNPRKRVGQIVGEPLRLHGLGSKDERRARVDELLELVGMSPEHINRFPYEFSGGQRQRIGIARALALEPRLIVADEPVSALDVSIQAQIINLLADLQRELGLTYLFVAHDLGVVRHVADRIAVMYKGRIVELGAAEAVCTEPIHPYTQTLLAAVPIPDPRHAANSQRERLLRRGDRSYQPDEDFLRGAEAGLVEHRPGHWAAMVPEPGSGVSEPSA